MAFIIKHPIKSLVTSFIGIISARYLANEYYNYRLIKDGYLQLPLARKTLSYRLSDDVKKSAIYFSGLRDAWTKDKSNFELCKYAVRIDPNNLQHIIWNDFTEEERKIIEDAAKEIID
uniref:Uncharacterized protein n=1 Tax=viral metagenome TaxID=1070528 RepID=A0A6C0EAZ2_9ZZZZ